MPWQEWNTVLAMHQVLECVLSRLLAGKMTLRLGVPVGVFDLIILNKIYKYQSDTEI